MTFYLTHHRAFCEELGRLHALDVSWDGRGSVPLRRKPLQSAMELFGRRPDLTIGSQVTLNRGGVEITLFRGGRDLRIHICKSGSVVISGHRPGLQPDFTLTDGMVSETLLNDLGEAAPGEQGTPLLAQKIEDDLTLQTPFEGFSVLRLRKGETPSDCQLLIGRGGPVRGLYAFHDAIDLPDDIYQDQPLTGQNGLLSLVNAYLQERRGRLSPAI